MSKTKATGKLPNGAPVPPPIRMVNNYILIVPELEHKPKGKLVLPEGVQEDALKRSPLGRVVAVGPGGILPSTGERVPLSVSVGDRVYVQLDPQRVKSLVHDGRMYSVCTEESIIGVIERVGGAN